MSPFARMWAWHRYARASGYAHGWPNFEEADYGPGVGVVYGGYLIPTAAEPTWGTDTYVPFAHLGLNCFEQNCSFATIWQAAHRWARFGGAYTGTPTCGTDFFGITLLAWQPRHYLGWVDVPLRDIEGHPDPDADPEGCVRGINRWANRNGYPAAFPTFERADHSDGRGVVYGANLMQPGAPVEWRDVRVSELRKHLPY